MFSLKALQSVQQVVEVLYQLVYSLICTSLYRVVGWKGWAELVQISPNAYSIVFPLDDSWDFFFLVLLRCGKIPQVACCGIALNFHTSASCETTLAYPTFVVQRVFLALFTPVYSVVQMFFMNVHFCKQFSLHKLEISDFLFRFLFINSRPNTVVWHTSIKQINGTIVNNRHRTLTQKTKSLKRGRTLLNRPQVYILLFICLQ